MKTTSKQIDDYYESGLLYLALLANCIKNWNFCMRQFRDILYNHSTSGMSAQSWIKKIENSPVFWAWWEGQYEREQPCKYIPRAIVCEIFGVEQLPDVKTSDEMIATNRALMGFEAMN